MSTISEQIRAYCLLSPNGKLRQPTKDDVVQAQIVLVTLKSALYLTKLEASGLFTHIFVDEATQGLECEVLMPLLFAREKTRIIIAGDHMQVRKRTILRCIASVKYFQIETFYLLLFAIGNKNILFYNI